MNQPTKTPKRDLKGIGIRFEPEIRAALEAEAQEDRRSISSVVEIAVIAYLKGKGRLPK
jgi:hypothetical protein